MILFAFELRKVLVISENLLRSEAMGDRSNYFGGKWKREEGFFWFDQ